MADDPRLPKLGENVGNCRITSVLGEGGVGIVYKGFEVDIEMERAVKMLKPDSIEILRKQFETEAKVTARLDHPNIVKVHGGGIWKGKLPFIQMEYIDGRSLRTILQDQSTIHPVVSLSIISVIASALDYAYGKSFSIWGNQSDKLVHLDLKPENLLLSRNGVLKVMDFGLAQLGEERYQLDWGTPAYMSPEQHDQQRVDCRSDIYSLGVILYEMFCGKRPFSDQIEQMIPAKLSGNFQSVKDINPSLPDKICTIIDSCLNPDKDKRYESHESLFQAINNTLSEISSQSPVEIIKSFSDDPQGFSPAVTSSRKRFNISSLKNSRFIALTISATVVIIFSLFFLSGKKAADGERALKQGKPDTNASTPAVNLDSTSLTPEQIKIQSLLSTQEAQTRTPRVNSAGSAPKKSVLSDAIKFYKKKDFTSVIVNITSSNLDDLPGPTRDSAIVLLTDAYYQTSSIREIIDLSSRYNINDSRFYSLVSLAYEIAPDFITAAGYFDKAIVAPSILWKQPRAELLFERAQFYKRHYDTAQDEVSKTSMIEAFRRFVNEGCNNSSPRCDEAADILKSF